MAELCNYKDPICVMCHAKKLMEIVVLQIMSPLGNFLACTVHYLRHFTYTCIHFSSHNMILKNEPER